MTQPLDEIYQIPQQDLELIEMTPLAWYKHVWKQSKTVNKGDYHPSKPQFNLSLSYLTNKHYDTILKNSMNLTKLTMMPCNEERITQQVKEHLTESSMNLKIMNLPNCEEKKRDAK